LGAEVVNGTVKITLAEDKMKAYMTVSPPGQGGTAVSLEDAVMELNKSEVQLDVDHSIIADIINHKKYNFPVEIAAGKHVANGTDGTITYRYKKFAELSPKEDESGKVDYKDLGLVQNITAGMVIADIVPETEGEDGYNVCGVQFKAVPGKKAKYLVGKGVYLSFDETQLIAEIDGNLRWHRDHFTVEATLVISEDIGTSTGNIDFIGDVIVKGNVGENFTVASKKSIIIQGSATNSTIVADGDIEIKTGSINSTITGKKNIKIGFCESSTINCDGDLTSSSFVSCNVFCQGTATAITGKGIIIGGKMTCLKGIVANIIGSDSYAKTHLTLGNGAILSEEKTELEKKEANLTEQIGKLLQISTMLTEHKKKLGSLTPDRDEMLSSAIRSRLKYSNDVKLIRKRIAEIDASIMSTYNLFIEARKELYPGVSVRIGTTRIKVENKNVRCRVYASSNGEIEIKPITGPT